MHRQASAAQSPLAQAHGTSSKMRSYFYPWERLTTERPNTIRLARCKMSSQAFSHRGKDLAMQRNFGLKPRRLTARPEGTAACGGLKPDSVNHMIVIQDERDLLIGGSQVIDERRQEWDQLRRLRCFHLWQNPLPRRREACAHGR